MDDGNEWCMERCAGGAQDKSIINPIMLRFRPIAPKPVADSAAGAPFPDNKNLILARKRTKRKYVRVSKNTRRKRKNIIRTSDEEIKDGMDKTVVTLQLLPEKPDGKEPTAGGSLRDLDYSINTRRNQELPTFLSFLNPVKDNKAGGFGLWGSDRTVVVPGIRVVESWVTVECVTDTCMDGGGLGSTDLDKIKNLEADTCPSFISNGYNTVEWVNEAYKRMIMKQRGDGKVQSEPEIMVWLVIKDQKQKLPYSLYQAFTCRVRLQYTCGEEKYSQTLPCDTWRMDCGGFAWRLDVKAALSLGR